MTGETGIEAIRGALRKAMLDKGISPRKLATAAGLGQTAVRDLMESVSDPRIGTLRRLAEVLNLPMDELMGHEPVRVAGRIGAGGTIAWADDDADQETVPRPPGALGPLMALVVVGDSMLPKYAPGDIVYIRRDHDGVLPEYLNDYCAVHAGDGGTYLKILAPGSLPERYTLRSLNAADMENVEVIWAAPVLFIMPRRALQSQLRPVG